MLPCSLYRVGVRHSHTTQKDERTPSVTAKMSLGTTRTKKCSCNMRGREKSATAQLRLDLTIENGHADGLLTRRLSKSRLRVLATTMDAILVASHDLTACFVLTQTAVSKLLSSFPLCRKQAFACGWPFEKRDIDVNGCMSRVEVAGLPKLGSVPEGSSRSKGE